MFSGLVEAPVPFEARGAEPAPGGGMRLWLPPPGLRPGAAPWEPVPGESIAVSGCCLTVAGIEPDGTTLYDLSEETLRCTWFRGLAPGRVLNVERAVRPLDRLGGHLVSGHVDAVGEIVALEEAGGGCRTLTFRVPPGFERYLVPKGSVTVDGISLTVVDPRGARFDVAVIPETLEWTSLGRASVGQPVHLEADLIGKWVERLLQERGTLDA